MKKIKLKILACYIFITGIQGESKPKGIPKNKERGCVITLSSVQPPMRFCLPENLKFFDSDWPSETGRTCNRRFIQTKPFLLLLVTFHPEFILPVDRTLN
jgi:hypothetical protein